MQCVALLIQQVFSIKNIDTLHKLTVDIAHYQKPPSWQLACKLQTYASTYVDTILDNILECFWKVSYGFQDVLPNRIKSLIHSHDLTHNRPMEISSH